MGANGGAPETKFNVLVVDDEPPILEVMVEMLQGAGWSVDGLSNGLEALQRVKRTRYDALVLDLYMPEIPGLLVHSKLKFVDRELWNRTVFVSAHFTSEELRLALQGTPRFVPKPFKSEALVAAVGLALPKVPRSVSEGIASGRPDGKPDRS